MIAKRIKQNSEIKFFKHSNTLNKQCIFLINSQLINFTKNN